MYEKKSSVVIAVSHLRKKFGDYQALSDVSFSVAEGEIMSLLGPNGAGKTTTINCILGFLKPDAGNIEIAGVVPQKEIDLARKNIAYIPEQVALYPRLTGWENLTFFSNIADVSLSKNQTLALLDKVKLPSHAFNKPISTYSKGMRQKVGIAIALAKQAKVLILDEPTSGLDPSACFEFSQLIKELAQQSIAILMATHDLYRAQEDAHSIAILNQGEIVHTLNAAELKDVQLESLYLEQIRMGSEC